MRTKTIALPRLNKLSPTIESTALKLLEEAGELGAAISRWRGYDGVGNKAAPDVGKDEALHAVTQELLDVAQTAITMMYVLEEQHGVDIENALAEHIDKLLRKGYLVLA